MLVESAVVAAAVDVAEEDAVKAESVDAFAVAAVSAVDAAAAGELAARADVRRTLELRCFRLEGLLDGVLHVGIELLDELEEGLDLILEARP